MIIYLVIINLLAMMGILAIIYIVDEFRLTYPKKHYTIIDCKEATNYNR